MHQSPSKRRRDSVAGHIQRRIENGGDRVWRYADFEGLSFQAVGQVLSRLTRAGQLRRLSKGVYYRPRETAFGQSRPSAATLHRLASKEMPVFPAGVAAASLLGFTSQTAAKLEIATTALSLPRKLVGENTVVRTRRPEAWARLSSEDAAVLEFLRERAKTSELTPADTAARLLQLLAEGDRYRRLSRVADTEPPRVRAMLGALGEQLNEDAETIEHLRSSLNTLSRFDFGALCVLPNAYRWQAKQGRAA